jgi:hypothetical protein
MADVTLGLTFQDGTVLRAQGFINIENWEPELQKLTMDLLPRDNRWEAAVGSNLDNHGSIRKLTVNGITYRVFPDSNPPFIPTQYKSEAQPTSGVNTRKMTKQVRSIMGLAISCNPVERSTLVTVAEN